MGEPKKVTTRLPKKWMDSNYYSGTVKKEWKRRRGDEKPEMNTVKVDGEGQGASDEVTETPC